MRMNAEWREGRLVIILAVATADAAAMREFVRGLSPASRYFRFMMGMRELSRSISRRVSAPGLPRVTGASAPRATCAG